MILRVAICTAAILCWNGVGTCGEFKREEVSAKAKWIMHMDLEKLNASQTHAKLLTEDVQGDFAKISKEMNGAFGIDPRTDLTGMTMYGFLEQGSDAEAKPKHRTVVITKGKFDIGRFTETVEKRNGYETKTYGDYTLMKFQMPKRKVRTSSGPVKVDAKTKPTWCCFQAKDVLVISDDADVLKGALDVLDKKTDGLAEDTFKHLKTIGKSPMFMAIANLGEMAGLQPKAQFFQGAEAIAISVREITIDPELPASPENAKLVIAAIVDGKDEVSTEQTKKMFDGLLAIAAMSQKKEMSVFRSLAQNVTIKQVKATLTITFTSTIAELAKQTELLKQLKPRVKIDRKNR